MIDKPCPNCGSNDWMGVEYEYNHPQHYDGISEYRCQKCFTRYGRWSYKELNWGECEPRFGGKK